MRRMIESRPVKCFAMLDLKTHEMLRKKCNRNVDSVAYPGFENTGNYQCYPHGLIKHFPIKR